MPEVDDSKYSKIAKFDSTLVENMEILSSMDNYYSWIGGEIKKHSGKRVLEIGCANGNLLSLFLDKDLVIGADYSKDYLDQIKKRFGNRKNFKTIFFDATDSKAALELRKYKLDTIITMNTFEHIKDDSLAFKNAYSILEKNGKMIVFVPAGMWLYSILDYEGGHYRRYTKRELRKKLESTGYKIEKINYINVAGALGWYANHTLMKKRIYSPGTFKIYNSLVPLFKLTESVIKPPFGLSLIAVARK